MQQLTMIASSINWRKKEGLGLTSFWQFGPREGLLSGDVRDIEKCVDRIADRYAPVESDIDKFEREIFSKK